MRIRPDYELLARKGLIYNTTNPKQVEINLGIDLYSQLRQHCKDHKTLAHINEIGFILYEFMNELDRVNLIEKVLIKHDEQIKQFTTLKDSFLLGVTEMVLYRTDGKKAKITSKEVISEVRSLLLTKEEIQVKDLMRELKDLNLPNRKSRKGLNFRRSLAKIKALHFYQLYYHISQLDKGAKWSKDDLHRMVYDLLEIAGYFPMKAGNKEATMKKLIGLYDLNRLKW